MSQPQWLADLQKIQRDMHQAPLGSLDGRVEQAWRAALQTPKHPQFQFAAQITSSFYQSQGYDLKAEQVLRQAVAAVPATDVLVRRGLTLQLAAYLESTQQLIKALAIREEIEKQPQSPAGEGPRLPRAYEITGLANLYERTGEFEKAEAAWKELAAQRAAELAQQVSTPGQRTAVAAYSLGYSSGTSNELASFYARRGRYEEAEEIYKAALAEAARSGSIPEWNGAEERYIGFLSQQRRFDQAVQLVRESIARMEASPDPQNTPMLGYRRQLLAGLLTQADRPDEALAVQKQAVEAAQARNPGSFEYFDALGSLARTLINQNRLEEAEEAVSGLRNAAAAAPRDARFHESMAANMLADIRQRQKRPEEAQQLRASTGAPTTVWDLAGPAQQSALQGDIAAAVQGADKALALAAERVAIFPFDVTALMSVATALMSKQEEQEARRIALATLQMLEQAPDHPRIADALGSIIFGLASVGMTAEAERAIERQNKILVATKGAESLALNSVSRGRIALMQRDSNPAGVIDEHKRMLARTEAATGSKSRDTLYALRELAWAYPLANDWPDEERVLARLLELTVTVSGRSSLDHAHLLVHMANRASQNRQFDQALIRIDQAIEIARFLPDSSMQVASMMQNRAQILQAKNAGPGGPSCTPCAAPANRWFDTNRFQRTDGTRLGNAPKEPVFAPNVIRSGTANAPAGAPAQPPAPAPVKR